MTGHKGGPCLYEIEAGSDLHGDTGVLIFCYPCSLFVLDFCIVETDTASNGGRHTQKTCLRTSGAKRKLYLGLL